jgi:hypothetical protein
MKSLENLWRCIAHEAAMQCHTSALLDLAKVKKRVEHEGLSFFSITLPNFGKDFDRSLDQGFVSDDLFAGFKRKGGLPLFLGGFLRNVFDSDGALRDDSELSITSIFAIRQLCYVFSKIELPCSSVRETRAIESFVSADIETGNWDDTHVNGRHEYEETLTSGRARDHLLDDLGRIASVLYRDVFTLLDRKIYCGDITPGHGPGAVSDRLLGNQKYDLEEWPTRLNSIFNYVDYGIPNARYYAERNHVRYPLPHEERPSRTILVPKTLKTPRVIAAEPASLQYMQQAVSRPLCDLLERPSSLVFGMIGFTDQSINQELARKGSSDRTLATLDLSEASDRVSALQVSVVTRNFPWFREALFATRSLKTTLPDGRIHTIRKFASMGSALCFPMEALVFLAGIFLGIERKLIAEGSRSRLGKKDVLSYRNRVRVYGDDIIVPVDCVDYVSGVFSDFGWKINPGKSFWTGSFRESCGGEYFRGHDVTVVKFRKLFPETRGDAQGVASLVAFRNLMYHRGFWNTAKVLDHRIRSLLRYFPIVESTSPLLGRESVLPYQAERTHPYLHQPLNRGWELRPVIPIRKASDIGSLLKCLLVRSEDPTHLERSGRPLAVDMKLRWRPPY